MLDLHPKYQVDERGKRVVILTEEEFENLLAWAEVNSPDPDTGLTLRPEFEAELREQEKRIKRGDDKTIPWEQVKRELGLD
ncbi:MAG: hypothetical protein EYC68_19265 [Chloroflexota bacterium]|nr:MAG: hypothetical protein EYC68_19265 [Chloroflexota bacterium]